MKHGFKPGTRKREAWVIDNTRLGKQCKGPSHRNTNACIADLPTPESAVQKQLRGDMLCCCQHVSCHLDHLYRYDDDDYQRTCAHHVCQDKQCQTGNIESHARFGYQALCD